MYSKNAAGNIALGRIDAQNLAISARGEFDEDCLHYARCFR